MIFAEQRPINRVHPKSKNFAEQRPVNTNQEIVDEDFLSDIFDS